MFLDMPYAFRDLSLGFPNALLYGASECTWSSRLAFGTLLSFGHFNQFSFEFAKKPCGQLHSVFLLTSISALWTVLEI